MPACQRHARAPTLLCSTGSAAGRLPETTGQTGATTTSGRDERVQREEAPCNDRQDQGRRGKNGRPGKAKSQLNELASLKNGRGGRTRTRNHRFWRPLFYQLELRPCNKRGELYKAGIKGKGFFLTFGAIAQRTSRSRHFLQPKGVTRCIYSLVWIGKQRQWG